MEEKILCKTEWVSLRKMIDPEYGVNGYDYLHEDRCDGQIVVILPYRYNPETNLLEFLLRSEVTPPWGMNESISSITGEVEKDSTSKILDAVRELKEEAGYEVEPQDMVFLGISRGTKSVDTVYYLFTVELTKIEKKEATGDGTKLEAMAHCYWTSDISAAVDPMVYVAFYKFNEYFSEE